MATMKGQYNERLQIVAMDEYTEKLGKITRQDVINRIKEERDSGKENWIAEGDAAIAIVEPDDGITIKVTSKEDYVFYVRVNENGKIEVITEGAEPSPELQTGDITFNSVPSIYTNANVTVEIETTKTDLKIQYNLGDPLNVSEWKAYTGAITFEHIGMIYARLADSYGRPTKDFAVENINNIDKLAPPDFEITGTNTTSNSIGINIEVEDSEATDKYIKSGIDKYYFSKDNGITWEPESGKETGEYIFSNLTQGTNYKLKVKVTDKAGNEKVSELKEVETGTIPGGITLTPSTTAWTNQNVKVKITTDVSGYTLQYSSNNSTWTDITSGHEVTMSQNGKVYARLWDGMNAGATAEREVNRIDKLKPNTFSIKSIITYNSITISGTTTDVAATSANGISGIKQYQYKIGTGNYQTGNSFTGLTPETIYTLYIKAIDNAGNETIVSRNMTTPGEWIAISTRAQLEKVANNWVEDKVSGDNTYRYKYSNNAKYVLMNNIDLNASNWTSLPTFYGTFEGSDKTISNMKSTGLTSGLFSNNYGVIRGIKISANISNYSTGRVSRIIGLIAQTNGPRRTNGKLCI